MDKNLILFRMGPPLPPASFSLVTSTNVGIDPPKISDFKFQRFFHTGVKFNDHT